LVKRGGATGLGAKLPQAPSSRSGTRKKRRRVSINSILISGRKVEGIEKSTVEFPYCVSSRKEGKKKRLIVKFLSSWE